MQTTTERAAGHHDLITRIKTAAARHAESGAELIVLLAHAKAVNAAEALGYSSLFAFCKDELLLSRDQTYRYLTCANVYMLHPQILSALKSGRLSATGVTVLASYVKASSVADGASALARAEGLTVEAIECLAVELMPKPDVACVVKPLVAKSVPTHALPFDEALPGSSVAPRQQQMVDASAASGTVRLPIESASPLSRSAEPTHRAKTTPLSPTSYKLTMTLSAEAYAQLNELRDLMSHTIPRGEIDKVVSRAIEMALAQARRAKQKTLKNDSVLAVKTASDATTNATDHPATDNATHMPSPRVSQTAADDTADVPRRRVNQTTTNGAGDAQAGLGGGTVVVRGERYVSAAVRRAVWGRDAGACAFVGMDGRRCGATWQLEVDHVIRVADGGESTVANTRLCCRRHNQGRERERSWK